MDPVRRKALGRSMPKRGKANRISRTDALLKRQRELVYFVRSSLVKLVNVQVIRFGLKHIYGMQNA